MSKYMIGGLLFVLIFWLGFVVGGMIVDPTEPPEDAHRAVLAISNNIGQSVMVEVYVMDGGEWDYIFTEVVNGTQANLTIDWEGMEKYITVFCVYGWNGNESVHRYILRENEWFLELLL